MEIKSDTTRDPPPGPNRAPGGSQRHCKFLPVVAGLRQCSSRYAALRSRRHDRGLAARRRQGRGDIPSRRPGRRVLRATRGQSRDGATAQPPQMYRTVRTAAPCKRQKKGGERTLAEAGCRGIMGNPAPPTGARSRRLNATSAFCIRIFAALCAVRIPARRLSARSSCTSAARRLADAEAHRAELRGTSRFREARRQCSPV